MLNPSLLKSNSLPCRNEQKTWTQTWENGDMQITAHQSWEMQPVEQHLVL